MLGAAFQFWSRSTRPSWPNSFTYGGQTLTQYPLTVFGEEIVRRLITFVVPLAFINYYPALYVLGPLRPARPARLGAPRPRLCRGRDRPPCWSPPRSGRPALRHYQSTGS